MCWYVDNDKISHKDPKIVDKISDALKTNLGK